MIDRATILTSIHDHRLNVRRVAYELRKDATIARNNGQPELAEKVDALADAITEAVNTHPCEV
jgi:hypothetical protein